MKYFVPKKPSAVALFTIVLSELCDFSVATFRQKTERYAEGDGDGGLTRATMRAACGLPAEVALHPDGVGHRVAPRPGAGVVQTVGARQVPGWLLDEEGLVRCHVSLVKHCLERGWGFSSEFPVSTLHQDVRPMGAGQGPCGDPAATEGQRVVEEGATAERQVRGAVDPAHPQGAC